MTCLSHKHEGLSSDSPEPTQKPDMVTHANHQHWGGRGRRIPGLASLAKVRVSFRTSETLSQNVRCTVTEESMHTHEHMHTVNISFKERALLRATWDKSI